MIKRGSGDRTEGSGILKEGKHDAVVDYAIEGTSATGKPKMTVYFKVGDRKLTTHVPLSVAFRVDQLFAAFVPAGVDDLTEDMLEGKSCIVEVKHEVYNGRNSAKVDNIFPATNKNAAPAIVAADDDCPF